MDSDEHTVRTQTHFRAHPHDPALPRLRTFARIPTHEPSHACAPSSAFLRKSRPASPHLRSHSHARAAPTSAHLRPHSDPLAAPRLHTFAPNPTTRLCPFCAPSPVSRPPSRPTSAHFCAQPHDPALPRLRTFARIPTH